MDNDLAAELDALVEERVEARLRMTDRLIEKQEEQLDEMTDAYFEKELEASSAIKVAHQVLAQLELQGGLEFLIIKDPIVRNWMEENKK